MADDTQVLSLGPLEVRAGGRTVPIAGVKLQSLLACSPSPCRTASPTTGCSTSCGATTHRPSRRTPCRPSCPTCAGSSDGDTVVRHGNGYALRRASRTRSTRLRLEHLVRDGRRDTDRGEHAARRRSASRAGVGLVRGNPFAELVDHWFAREAAPRFDELVLDAHEGLVDSELAMGRHADVLATVGALVARASGPRALPRPAHRRPVPVRPAGRRPAGLPRRPSLPARRARPRPRAGAAPARALGARPRPGAGRADRPDLADRQPARAAGAADVVRRAGGRARRPLEQAVGAGRLVSLVGPGGVGKTRLVLELARRLAASRRSGSSSWPRSPRRGHGRRGGRDRVGARPRGAARCRRCTVVRASTASRTGRSCSCSTTASTSLDDVAAVAVLACSAGAPASAS